jgi:hypothetical protein
VLVNDHKIAPSEVWQLDYPEIYNLLDMVHNANNADISMMINAERKANGAKDKRFLI